MTSSGDSGLHHVIASFFYPDLHGPRLLRVPAGWPLLAMFAAPQIAVAVTGGPRVAITVLGIQLVLLPLGVLGLVALNNFARGGRSRRAVATLALWTALALVWTLFFTLLRAG